MEGETVRFLLVLAFGLLPCGAWAKDRIAAAVAANVADYVDQDTPGIGVLVMRDGVIVHMKGYGLADLETNARITDKTIFDLASVSKQMTALAAALQMQDGLYDESSQVADVLPAFATDVDAKRPLTVGDLIHHLSGLPDYLDWDEYGAETTNAEVVDWLAEQERDAVPGTEFSYSNSGYLVLGSVVAASAGVESLAEVLETRIWGPLGMTATTLVTPADDGLLVVGYAGTDGDFENSVAPTVTEGDGNVYSSLANLALYEAALVAGDLVGKDWAKRIIENGFLDDGSPIDEDGFGYGFGWEVGQIDGQDYALHSGSWMGTSTWYQRNLTTGVTVILLANGEDMGNDALALEIEALAD